MNPVLVGALAATITTILGALTGFALDDRRVKEPPKEQLSIERPSDISQERWDQLKEEVDAAAAKAFPELVGR